MSGFSVSAFGAASCRSGKHVNMVTTNFRIRNSRWQNPLPGAVNFRREFSLSSVLASGSNRQLKASQPPYNILFCGNDPFSVSVLDAVWRRKDLWKRLVILTTPYSRAKWAVQKDRTADTAESAKTPVGNPVEMFAQENGIPVVRVGKSESLEIDVWAVPEPFHNVSHDNILLTASYGRMIPSSMLQRFKIASTSLALNVHPSLLPQLRGAAPIQTAIARRILETGITLQQLSDGTFDQGNVIAQRPFALPQGTTYDDVIPTIGKASGELTVEALATLPERLETSVAQDPSKVTWALKPTSRTLTINWDGSTAEDIEALFRGFKHVSGPVTWLAPYDRQGKVPQPFLQVELREVAVPSSNWADEYPAAAELLRNAPPGTAVWQRKMDMLIVKTAPPTGPESQKLHAIFVTRLLTLSKSPLTAPDWWRGYGERLDSRKRIRFSNAPPVDHDTKHREAVAAFKQANKARSLAKDAARAESV